MASNTEPAWTITAQVQSTDMGPANAYVDGVRVTFQTAAGAIGSLFIPNTEYTVERVRSLVAARAAVMDQVAGLTG